MRKRDAKRLLQALNAPQTVRVREQTSKWPLYGYIVGLSDEFVLLHRIDGSLLCFNGYSALPLREIAEVPTDEDNDFNHRALQLKGLMPIRQPDILLLDFPGLLSSADAHFPLVTLETAHLYPHECHIGRVAKLTNKSIVLREIDSAAKWNYVEKYRFRDITRIDFGDGYADALWRVSEHEKESATNS